MSKLPQQCRPRDHLIDLSRRIPGVWSVSDEMRASRGAPSRPNWPAWCYLPIAGWNAIVKSAAGVTKLNVAQMGDVSRLAAIGAWRVTQGIYRFDSILYDAVVATPISGDIPSDVLYRLPEWCVYIETPGIFWAGKPLHGVWVHLEFDSNTGRTELRMLTDSDVMLLPMVLHLGNWPLAEALQRAVAEAARSAKAGPLKLLAETAIPADIAAQMRPVVEPILSLLLYLCSQNAEIGDGSAQPKYPEPTKTKRGPRLFAPDTPTTWDVGVRLGAALRRAYHQAETGQGGEHAGPRPHIRRAHWHGFRFGPMKRSDGTEIIAADRKFDLRWLPPIAVNLDDTEQLPAVIHPVRS